MFNPSEILRTAWANYRRDVFKGWGVRHGEAFSRKHFAYCLRYAWAVAKELVAKAVKVAPAPVAAKVLAPAATARFKAIQTELRNMEYGDFIPWARHGALSTELLTDCQGDMVQGTGCGNCSYCKARTANLAARHPSPCGAFDCDYCDTTEALRVTSEGGSYVAPSLSCKACFIGTDDGPGFDDLPLPSILTAHAVLLYERDLAAWRGQQAARLKA